MTAYCHLVNSSHLTNSVNNSTGLRRFTALLVLLGLSMFSCPALTGFFLSDTLFYLPFKEYIASLIYGGRLTQTFRYKGSLPATILLLRKLQKIIVNSNLPPILHRFQVMAQFSLARGECLTLTLSLGVIPC